MSSINIDDKLVKKAGDKLDIDLTEEQAKEWITCANDKYYFFENYVYIQAPKGKVLFKPRDYQRRVVDACEKNRHVVGLVGRQAGKCCLAESQTTCKVINNGVEYELKLSMGEIHLLSKCSNPEDVELFITNKRKSENDNTADQGDS